MRYNALIKALIDNERNKLVIEWDSGLKLTGTLDTVFETDNGLEDDDVNFKEYDAAVFKVEEILNEPNLKEEDEVYNWVKNNNAPLIELSLYDNPPTLIELTNGEAIWNKGD
ncbi:hypothetical protein [Terribacillus saccharophilus]|uniref:hypothetical protein n=1 Tax=Terribacillus saccharophilus TaxID=361277 RepID=UPI002DCB75FD|nr:hypothetical protein [Terribacillus saccharophilus]MEC0291655.1 hypothetical protein [Terribacillus saccharophilus]